MTNWLKYVIVWSCDIINLEKAMAEFDHKKATQAVNHLALKEGGKINKMKAIKLLYFAERYHLRKYGRLIVNDDYWAMKLGPIQSTVMNIVGKNQGGFLDDAEAEYSEKYLGFGFFGKRTRVVESREKVDENVFSQTDIEALNFSYDKFGSQEEFDLADLTHCYPEWSKFKERIESKSVTRVRMDVRDFFSNPDEKDEYFDQSEEDLENARYIFEENTRNEKMWA